MLKRGPSLTELAKSRLKQRILNDEFEAGRIPSETDPVILTFNYTPTRLIKFDYPPDAFHQPVFQFLDIYCQQQLSYYLSEIVPLVAPAWLASVLHLPQPQTALLSFEEIGYNQENLPILRACSYFRDDLLRLRLMRREG
jgi:DNA-binding GntR family transcriptional regulator